MNILQTEDMVKGMPDQQLLQQAQAPDGQIPQYLLVSEVQRRQDMRKRYQAQEQQPQGTVAEQILGGGQQPQGMPQSPPQVPAPGRPQQMAPQQMPPQQMAQGGIIGLANGGQIIRIPDRMGQMHEVSWAGYPDPQTATEAYFAGQNEPVNIRSMASGEDQNFSMQFGPDRQMIGMGGYESAPNAGIIDRSIIPGTAAGERERLEQATIQEQARIAAMPPRPEKEVPGVMEGIGAFWSDLSNKVLPPDAADPVFDFITGGDSTGGGITDLAPVDVTAEKRESPQTVFPGKQVQGTGTDPSAVDMLKGMYGMESDPVPDIADLMAEQRKDAYSNALMQLGAGIAGDDLAGGLSRAGTVAFQGRQDARDLDLKARMAQYTADRGDVDRDIKILSQAGVIEASQMRSHFDREIQSGRNENEVMRLARWAAELSVKDVDFFDDEKTGETGFQKKQKAIAAALLSYLPKSVRDSRGLNNIEDLAGGSVGGATGERPPLDSF